MNRYKAFASLGLVLSVMLSVAGCTTQGVGSIQSTNVTNHISNTTSNTPQNVASNGTDNTAVNSNHASSQPSKSDSFYMVSPNTGWDFADVPGNTFKVILRTVDGGQTWKNVTPPQLTNKQSTFAGGTSLNANDVLVVTRPSTSHGAYVFRTTNGGKNWSSTKLLRGYETAWLNFINSQQGWLLGVRGAATGMEPSDLYYTTNGGRTWTRINTTEKNLPIANWKTGVSFENAQTGWITVDNKVSPGAVDLYVSHDGGRTWTQNSVSLPSQMSKQYAHPIPPVFSSATNGVLPVYFDGGTQSILYFTTDGGNTWVPSSPVPLKKISHVAVTDQRTVLVTDGHSLYVTTNSGKTWKNSSSISGTSNIIGIHPASDGTSAIVFTLMNGELTTHQINIDQ